jgi:hypothetical protein
MKQQVIAALTGLFILASAQSVRSETDWTPVWLCLLQCSGTDGEELTTCLESCAAQQDADASVRATAEILLCKASLMRAEALQFSCHSRCLTTSDATNLSACSDRCDDRYEGRSALILGSARCAGMPTGR